MTVGVRVVHTVEACRSLLGVPDVDDERLERVKHGDRYETLKLVEEATAGVADRLTRLTGHSRTVKITRVHELLAELHEEWHAIQQEMLAHQVEMMGGIREALHRLRGADSVSRMVERATAEVCRSCGVRRCVLLRVEEGKLVPESVTFAGAPAFQEEWTAFAREHPPVVDPRDPEVQLLRRNQPILVSDPATSRGISPVAEAAHSTGYVAAPVTVKSNVVATLHADTTWDGAPVDPVTRDVIATFAEGFGYALERTILVERMRAQFRSMREMMAEANTTLDELFDAGLSLHREEDGEITTVARGPAIPLPGESRLMGLLTRRELEVVELMARGASNADIAMDLVISEGTVKSHVKHILRKMRAANRAQAVSCYMRLQSMSR